MLFSRLVKSFILCIGLLFFISCSTAFYLDNLPQLSEKIFYDRVLRVEKKIQTNDQNPEKLLKACTLRTQYTYAFTMEAADRKIAYDYTAGKTLYDEALASFEKAIEYGESAFKIRHPDFISFKDWIKNDHEYVVADVPLLYWLAAAHGGAISASRGQAKRVIQLPIVGYLLESALTVEPSWNFGATHAAMISYSMSRMDIPGDKTARAKEHYLQARHYSDGLNAGAHVSFAENVYIIQQDKEKFAHLLQQVIAMQTVTNNELQLGNMIAKKRARWLLFRMDELFY